MYKCDLVAIIDRELGLQKISPTPVKDDRGKQAMSSEEHHRMDCFSDAMDIHQWNQ